MTRQRAYRNELEKEICEGIARSLWMNAYASYADENRDDASIARPGPGGDWSDVVPELEPYDGNDTAADRASYDLVDLYNAENGTKYIEDLFARAGVDNDEAGEFGWYLGNMALGTGISWFDDHPKFPLKKPFFECHFDGSELYWSGGSAPTTVNPEKTWPKSEVQSLLFPVGRFSEAKAKQWAKEHGFKYGKVDTTDEYHRLRQFDPKGHQCRTIDFGSEIRAVVCSASNPDEWERPKVREDWPETWDKKIGPYWYTVEKAKRDGWYLGWSHKRGDADSIDRGARFPTKEAAMKFAEEHAGATRLAR